MIIIMNISVIELSKIFGSRAKAQEIVLLLAGAKPVVRQGFYSDELDPVVMFCNNNNIHIVRSKFLVRIEDNHAQFSNKGRVQRIIKRDIIESMTDEYKGMFFLYLSLNRTLAEQAAYSEENQDHKSLGLLLGYPECCIKYFDDNFSEQNTDLEQTSSNPYTKLSLRDKDYVILSHFPCNPECQKSINLAKKYLSIISRYDLEYTEELLRRLS